MSSPLDDAALWALGRGAGVVLLVLVSTSLLLGLLARSGRTALGLPRFAVALVHRDVALLAVVFLVVHVVTMVVDPDAQLGLLDTVVPFLGERDPLWLGLGTLTLDLTAAVVVTSLLRGRVGLRAWRAVHWGAYALWPLAVAHALGTGTDTGSAWFLAVVAACVLAVLAGVVRRVSRRFAERPAPRVSPLDRQVLLP